MRAGELRERVTIEKPVQVAGKAGATKTTWTEVATNVHARVTPLRGQEQVNAMQLSSKVSHRVKLRYRSDVVAEWRIIWDGLTLNIRAVTNPDERRRFTELACDSGVAS